MIAETRDANIDHVLLANRISLWTKEVVGFFSPVQPVCDINTGTLSSHHEVSATSSARGQLQIIPISLHKARTDGQIKVSYC